VKAAKLLLRSCSKSCSQEYPPYPGTIKLKVDMQRPPTNAQEPVQMHARFWLDGLGDLITNINNQQSKLGCRNLELGGMLAIQA
jgi:hypothetical protein